MKVESVKDVTTRESPVTYQLTIRVNVNDLRYPKILEQDLYNRVIAAIGGIE